MQMYFNKKERRFVSVAGTELAYPETVIYGACPGQRVVVSAGVHSREYVGIEALRRLAESLCPENIRGELHLIHAINYSGLIERSSDIIPADGKNLNREFPGDTDGSPTQRLAAHLEERVIRGADCIIDLHSGGGCEYLVPHVYFQSYAAPEVCARSEALARRVGVEYIVRSRATNGFYGYAGLCGVPAIIIERGQCGLWTEDEVCRDVEDVENLLRFCGVLSDGKTSRETSPRLIERFFHETAPQSGCWYPAYRVGERFRHGDKLGEIRDIFGEALYECRAECDGVVLYQAAALGIESGTPMIAYGEIDGNA